jgi:TPP-dependent pyruvate/acetoin dehydrogenase alpha subunit
MAVAYGVNLNELMAELLGKKTGLCKGKGGHMHIYDKRVNFAASSIIGEQMPAAVGMAMACKMNKTGGIAVSVTGDGAANQGAAHEALNFAAVQKLPYLAVIEDNSLSLPLGQTIQTAAHHTNFRVNMSAVMTQTQYMRLAKKRSIMCALDRGPMCSKLKPTGLWGTFFQTPPSISLRPKKKLGKIA